MSSQLIHNVVSRPNGMYDVPAVDSSLAYPNGVVARYDIVSLGDNSKLDAVIEVTNKSSQSLDLALQETDSDVSDNGWPDYNFESAFADIGSTKTIVPMGSVQFTVSLTKKFLQLINKSAEGIGGQVFIQASFPKDVTEIGPAV